QTQTWAERTPRDAPEAVRETARMLDARQAELGRQLAGRPPEWALNAWGVPPQEPGALREDWERRAAIVESYRESAGITDPAQAIGPVSSRCRSVPTSGPRPWPRAMSAPSWPPPTGAARATSPGRR